MDEKDIMERAMAGGDKALWARIGAQARGQIRMKRLGTLGAAAGALLLVLGIVALIGLNQARAGAEGWLARVFTPVWEARIYRPPDPGDNPGFIPIKIENATWQMIETNTEAVLRPYLPMELPDRYVFTGGSIRQPDRDTFDMTLQYEVDGRAFRIQYQYRYEACPEAGDTNTAGRVEWDGTEVFLWENKAAWREADIYTLIEIEGDIGAGEMEEVFRSVKDCYIDEATRRFIETGQ